MLIYFIRESHTSQLLELKVTAIQSHRADLILRTAPTLPRPSIFQPMTLLFTNPIVFLSSLTNAFTTALLYLFAVAFPPIYAHYAWSRQITTLTFLFIALGLLLSTLTQFHDRHIIRKSRLSNHPLITPERNLFGLFIAAPALAIALWWFAWTIPNSVTSKLIAWPASATSLVLLGYGINTHSTSLPRYILSSHNRKNDASAAFAALLVTKALLGAVFPLFTQQMFEKLDYNVAGSVLAAIATAFCLVPFLLFCFGEKWRGSSGGLSDGRTTDDGEEEEEEGKKCPKPKKTVRWGDETTTDSSSSNESSSETKESEDHRASESESESENRTSGSTEMSGIETTEAEAEAEVEKPAGAEIPALARQETRVERRDFANMDRDENDENEISALSRIDTQQSESEGESVGRVSDEIARVETKSSSHSSSSSADGKEDKKEKKMMARVDYTDKDNGAAGGFWGMDLERLAVLPYF